MLQKMRIGFAVGVGVCGLLLQTVPASAQLSADECKCQQGASQAQGKFAADKAKCLTKCQQGVRKGANPASDCTTPFGGATATCVSKAESKAQSSQVKKCTKDCPECYSNGDCTADATAKTATTEAAVDALNPVIYCDDSGSGDQLTKDEAKCQDTTAKNAASFARSKAKCYQKCRAAECKGQVAPGACDAPTPTDQKTIDCINKAEGKCASAIDKACEPTAGDKPECYGTTTGAQRCGQIEQTVDALDGSFYCASPSGAFLE